MKRWLVVFVFISCFSLLKGQTYYPLVKDSAGWSWEYLSYDGYYYDHRQGKLITYGDTTINSKSYKKVYSQETNRDLYDVTDITYYGSMREDSAKKVWYIGNTFDCGDTIEFLLYDFALAVGDTMVTVCNQWPDTIRTDIVGIDSVLVQNEYRKRWEYHTDNLGYGYWIEGIGARESLFAHLHYTFESGYWLNCYHEGDSLVYDISPYNYCNWADGVNESNMHEYIDLYPNPFTTSTTLSIEGPAIGATFYLYDQLGRQVKSVAITQAETILQRDDLPAGIYFYSLQSAQGLHGTGKLIVTD